MKLPLPDNTFPTLHLTPEEKRTLEEAAETIVKQTIEQYYELLTLYNGVVDEKRWRKIKQREDVRVYRERISSLESHKATADPSHKIASNESSDVITKGSVLMFGTILGNLDDVVYGVLSPTTEEMQLKTAFIDDGMCDWKLLASIIKPSEQDPFRALSIRWTVAGFGPPLSAVMRVRDAVYIDSSGIAITPNGERIGYHLHHSVEIPGVHDLTDLKIVRAHVSTCEFFRQLKDNCVEVYARTIVNPMGDIPDALVSPTLSEVPVMAFTHRRYAEMKKLTRMLRSRQRQMQSGSSLESSSSV